MIQDEEVKKKNKLKDKWIKIIIMGVIIIIASIAGVLYKFADLYQKKSYVEESEQIPQQKAPDEYLGIIKMEREPDPEYAEVDGITNVLLIGIDARDPQKNSRADTIMILTIDSIHKKLKLSSIMRDTYLPIPKHGEQKINSSFYYGEAPLLMKTIEQNYKVKLEKYAIIDFSAFIQLVDIIGGLDIDVKDYMLEDLNNCIGGIGNKDSVYLEKEGVQHLTGEQVLGYARMRHIKGAGYGRTERQREVVSLLLNKVLDTSVLKFPKIAAEMLPYINTNVPLGDALNLAYTIYKINNYDVEKLQIPVNELSAGLTHPEKGWLLINDINQNAKVLNNFIFEDIAYNKSNVSYSRYKSYVAKYYNEVNELEEIANAQAEALKEKEVLQKEENAVETEVQLGEPIEQEPVLEQPIEQQSQGQLENSSDEVETEQLQ
ncbi:hypothetical protein SH2C18_07910 [Clostridium sediminicola]|uniref:LCP family protein n=1 Tax=Clostridium sediminicola TaxID=3114879 RepID=UPI0031F26891